MSQFPGPIYEFDPDKPPRTSAIILVICGLLAVGFVMVNVVFTGEDPYQTTWWPEDDARPIQERGNIVPNVWRGPGSADELPEVAKTKAKPKTGVKPPATLPLLKSPFLESPLKPMSPATVPSGPYRP